MSSPAQPQPQPTPRRLESRPPKQSIDLHSALASTVRAWLAARDTALWTFCSGVDGETLAPIDLADATEAVGKMNRLRDLALEFAGQLDPRRTGQAVLQEAVEELLAAEAPKFLLRVEHLPEAF